MSKNHQIIRKHLTNRCRSWSHVDFFAKEKGAVTLLIKAMNGTSSKARCSAACLFDSPHQRWHRHCHHQWDNQQPSLHLEDLVVHHSLATTKKYLQSRQHVLCNMCFGMLQNKNSWIQGQSKLEGQHQPNSRQGIPKCSILHCPHELMAGKHSAEFTVEVGVSSFKMSEFEMSWVAMTPKDWLHFLNLYLQKHLPDWQLCVANHQAKFDHQETEWLNRSQHQGRALWQWISGGHLSSELEWLQHGESHAHWSATIGCLKPESNEFWLFSYSFLWQTERKCFTASTATIPASATKIWNIMINLITIFCNLPRKLQHSEATNTLTMWKVVNKCHVEMLLPHHTAKAVPVRASCGL